MQTATYNSNQVQVALNTSFLSVFLLVPTRFVTALGSPIPISTVTAAVASRTGIRAANISNIQTFPYNVAGVSVFGFNFVPPNSSVTSNSVALSLLSLYNGTVFNVTISPSNIDLLYITSQGESAQIAQLC